MLTFACQCGNELHFSNTQCVQCELLLGLIPDEQRISAFTETHQREWLSVYNGKHYRPCKNYTQHQVCNWMIASDDTNEYCKSCRLTEVRPDIEKGDNLRRWFLLEQAKRRLLYSTIKFNLPINSKTENPEAGLGFAFLEDIEEDNYGNELTVKQYVVTGHNNGLITINIKEADHARRIDMREKMNESYRTLVGHFRHESGHYYWDRLINETDKIDEFRELFGDERLNYEVALDMYYKNGPIENWQNTWISAYASMHPWEDWAETWAHYFHMVDTLETANNFDVSISQTVISNPYVHDEIQTDYQIEESFTQLFNDWCRLTRVLNGLNRSMGLDDAYPFVISISSLNKLRFVHQIINKFNNDLKS
ncbi:zinc-binding metallopeptidase family protein [Pleionea sediminis]|uniref:zinc-binding metallopeptidase family protein n=1 Tax=Pleionea sediminis TaxID=2569479 RepID=UPI0011849D43|nr:putative zinc-binding metallopeptidase [Pleionea sediminis]